MSVRPKSKIPKLVGRDAANLSWETIERLELDFDILNQHLDAKQKAVEEAVASEKDAKRLVDAVFNQALMCVEPNSRPEDIKSPKQKVDFAIEVLKQLQIALKESRDKQTQAQRVFDYQKEELENQSSRTIEQLKAENFKTRAKYRAAMIVLQNNGLSIDEELLQQEINQKVKQHQEENEQDEDTLHVRLTPEEDDTEEDNGTVSIPQEPEEPSTETEQPTNTNETASDQAEVIDIPVESSVETFDPIVKHNGKEINTETGEVISSDEGEGWIDPTNIKPSQNKPKEEEDDPALRITLHANDGRKFNGHANDANVHTINGHTMDELSIYEDVEIAENIFKEISNTDSEVDENAKDVEDSDNAELMNDEEPEMLSALEFIGKTGAFQFSDFKMGGIDIQDRTWRRYLDHLVRRGILQTRTVKTLKTPKLRIFALTDIGKELVKERIGKEVVESKIESWVRDHANLEHALGIYQLAEFFESDGWSVESRRSKTIRETHETHRLLSPDLYIEKIEGAPGCRYIEFERGNGHTPDQIREWIDRRIEFSSRDIANRRWMIIVPNQEAVTTYYGLVTKVWTDYYVSQGREADYGATFIFKSAKKLFEDPNGDRVNRRETLPLGKHNPDKEYHNRRGRS